MLRGLAEDDDASVARIRALVAAIGCPTQAPDLGAARWLELMQVDKKAEGGNVRYVVLPALGQAEVRTAPPEPVLEVLRTTVAAAA